MRTLAEATTKLIGQTVTVSGWVHSRRDHGGLVFIDLRDHTGVVQLVIHPHTKEAFELAGDLRDEFVISATGLVRERDEALKNANIATGSVELNVQELTVLNRSEVLPIQPFSDQQANEELRLK